MVILQFIMGFIMGIYLMEIVSGHLVTKKVMAPQKYNQTTTTKTILIITRVNGWVMVWVISFDESDLDWD